MKIVQRSIPAILSGLLLTTTVYADSAARASKPDKKVTAGSAQGQSEDLLEAKIREQQALEVENALQKASLEKELADLWAEIERLRLEKEAAILRWDLAQQHQQQEHMQALMALSRARETLMAEVDLAKAQLTQMEMEIEQARSIKRRARLADGPIQYLDEPLQKTGILLISDRSIRLNGVITPWKADYLEDKIRYFNNKDSQKPIFVIITHSPGGSALAGARILKAMESSRAPVYVVVEEFAASMAAIITTLATQSYAYPNAIILHHQPSLQTTGSLRTIREQYEELQAWWQRLGGPVAKKMGITLEKLDKQMHVKSACGDWQEFADNACKLKWVDHIILGIDDSSVREKPDVADYTFVNWFKDWYGVEIKPEQATDPALYLPQLSNKDFYYIYNPDNRYQVHNLHDAHNQPYGRENGS